LFEKHDRERARERCTVYAPARSMRAIHEKALERKGNGRFVAVKNKKVGKERL